MESLQIRSGNTTQVIQLGTDPIRLGRLEDNDLRFPDDLAVSRHHAVVERYDGHWRVRDLNSANGTYINQQRITCPTQISLGDAIQIGQSVLYVGRPAAEDGMLTTIKGAVNDETAPLMSAREREVLRLVANGLRDAEIAERMSISVRTVQSHLDRVRDKCGVRRRAELTKIALQLGIADGLSS